jgi:hydroxymethylpyrimidine/phosphomethylpyrimidine kinase
VTPTVALTIAGSDSGGGAGVQADLKTFAACGVFGTCAITAVTAQNTTEVRAVHALAADILVAQIVAVLDDFEVRAVKTGLLANAAYLLAIAELADAVRLPKLVVDPVVVASSGQRLLDPDVERLYIECLFRHAAVVIPNLSEAGVLLGTELHTRADQRDAAKQLAGLGPQMVVVKGGHRTEDAGDLAVDVVAIGSELIELTAPHVDTAHTHGGGCTFASAVAAQLALGRSPLDAVRTAKHFVHRAITGGARWNLGAGHGPLDHFNWETP